MGRRRWFPSSPFLYFFKFFICTPRYRADIVPRFRVGVVPRYRAGVTRYVGIGLIQGSQAYSFQNQSILAFGCSLTQPPSSPA